MHSPDPSTVFRKNSERQEERARGATVRLEGISTLGEQGWPRVPPTLKRCSLCSAPKA